MCNLSELVLERGIKEGRKQGRRSGLREGEKRGIEKGQLLLFYGMVEDKTLTLATAAERLSLSEEEFMEKVNRYRKKKRS